ncbi:type I-F CRISPR-associated protein Csy2 [Photorhabdus australis]|uniref:type I-F CRISPR-associated protein Csy2 n=1 Tax=Photorhabdus australis TaxID=286156 RepID=UPI0005609E96
MLGLIFLLLICGRIPTQENKQPEIGDPEYWEYVLKPDSGYLVPLLTGYQAILPLYSAEQVEKTRDLNIPYCFVEAIYGVGEWKSPHRINDILLFVKQGLIEDNSTLDVFSSYGLSSSATVPLVLTLF